jgi:hypothetical protein
MHKHCAVSLQGHVPVLLTYVSCQLDTEGLVISHLQATCWHKHCGLRPSGGVDCFAPCRYVARPARPSTTAVRCASQTSSTTGPTRSRTTLDAVGQVRAFNLMCTGQCVHACMHAQACSTTHCASHACRPCKIQTTGNIRRHGAGPQATQCCTTPPCAVMPRGAPVMAAPRCDFAHQHLLAPSVALADDRMCKAHAHMHMHADLLGAQHTRFHKRAAAACCSQVTLSFRTTFSTPSAGMRASQSWCALVTPAPASTQSGAQMGKSQRFAPRTGAAVATTTLTCPSGHSSSWHTLPMVSCRLSTGQWTVRQGSL